MQSPAPETPRSKFWRKPLDGDRLKPKKGEVHLMRDRCKGCGFCIEFCPRDVLEMSDEFNAKGYHFPRVKDPEQCADCHLCEMLCPEFAIWITEKVEKRKKVAN